MAGAGMGDDGYMDLYTGLAIAGLLDEYLEYLEQQ